MGFFDTIDRLKKTDTTSKSIEDKANQAKEEKTTLASSTPVPIPKKRPDQATQRTEKTERLAFLRPCPICKGRSFVYGSRGGFFCSTCTPRIEGQPVEATGPERKQNNQGVVKSTGPNGSTPQISTSRLGENPDNFKAAWPWLKSNLDALLSAGWTKAALFRRGKHRYPTGAWGAAWSDAWTRNNTSISINKNGDISIIYNGQGRTVIQTIYRNINQ